MHANVSTQRSTCGRLACQLQANQCVLDLDWLGQRSVVELEPHAACLRAWLADLRMAAGEGDPLGPTPFDETTPVVVLLRALARLAGVDRPGSHSAAIVLEGDVVAEIRQYWGLETDRVQADPVAATKGWS